MEVFTQYLIIPIAMIFIALYIVHRVGDVLTGVVDRIKKDLFL